MSVADSRPLTVEEIVRQLRDVLDEVNRSPLSRGRLIDTDTTAGAVQGAGVEFIAGVAKSIPHKLGRRARGAVPVLGADVVQLANLELRVTPSPSGISPATHVTLTPNASGRANVWVF